MRDRSNSRAWWSSSSMTKYGHPGRVGPMQNHRRPNVSNDVAEARVSGVYRYEFLLGDINATVLFHVEPCDQSMIGADQRRRFYDQRTRSRMTAVENLRLKRKCRAIPEVI